MFQMNARSPESQCAVLGEGSLHSWGFSSSSGSPWVPRGHHPPAHWFYQVAADAKGQKKKKNGGKTELSFSWVLGHLPEAPCENLRLSGTWPQLPSSPAADLGQAVPVLWATGFSSPKWKCLQGQAREARVESTKELWWGRMCTWGCEWQQPGNCWRHALIGSFASAL